MTTRIVKFKQIDGNIIEVSVPDDITIKDLKTKIKDQSNLKEDEMRLIFKAKSLTDA